MTATRWAMDFYLGRVTREHADIDWFVWATDLSTLAGALMTNGWIDIATHPAGQQRDLVKGGVEIGLAPLARRSTVRSSLEAALGLGLSREP